jgi:hypothetical protein
VKKGKGWVKGDREGAEDEDRKGGRKERGEGRAGWGRWGGGGGGGGGAS